jgi:CTP:molybdopterin cytidylyltransferase MocA
VSHIAAVVLAAGEASRFGAPKQRLLLDAVLTRLSSTLVDEIVVVQGAYELQAEDVEIVTCDQWSAGPGASLRCGLAALSSETRAAIVVLADGPDLAPAAVDRVIAYWKANDGLIVAASYDGVRGHPLLISRRAWNDVPDKGLRSVQASLVPCDDLGPPGDVDTPDDLPARLR